MINADDEVTLAYLLSPEFEISNTEGKPLTGGYIEVYLHGTRSKYYCYSDWNGSLHPFKIPLDSLGANIILASTALSYDIYIYNKYGNLIMSRYNIVPSTGVGTIIKDVVTISSDDNSVNVTTTDQTNWNLSIKDTVDKVEQNTQDISYVKEELNQDKEDFNNLKVTVDNHTTQIEQIQEEIADIPSSVVSAGKAIDLTNNIVSVKYSKGLEVNIGNELQVKAGLGIYLTNDGKLTTNEPEENFIDITNEWVFINGFRLHYNGQYPGYGNELKIMYSPISDTVKFTNGGRVNTNSGISDTAWHVMMQYKGDRFYTTYNAPDVSKIPILLSNDLLIGANDGGTSDSSLVKYGYVGAGSQQESNCGLAIQKFIGNDAYIYGVNVNGTLLKVSKKA